jgi:hypothetical protein
MNDPWPCPALMMFFSEFSSRTTYEPPQLQVSTKMLITFQIEKGIDQQSLDQKVEEDVEKNQPRFHASLLRKRPVPLGRMRYGPTSSANPYASDEHPGPVSPSRYHHNEINTRPRVHAGKIVTQKLKSRSRSRRWEIDILHS